MVPSMYLNELITNASAVVESVENAHPEDKIASRLRDLGFVAGEPVKVVAKAPWGQDPLVVQIGSTRFALRQNEARRVVVSTEVNHG